LSEAAAIARFSGGDAFGAGRINLKSLNSPQLFRRRVSDETILSCDETISCFGADIRKRRVVTNATTQRRAAPAAKSGDGQMRNLSFIVAFAFALVAPSLAGSPNSSLPGAGTFAYNGSQVVDMVPQVVVVATR
jgi:hypothetical protein